MHWVLLKLETSQRFVWKLSNPDQSGHSWVLVSKLGQSSLFLNSSVYFVLHVSFLFSFSLSQIEILFWELEFVLFLLFSLKVWSSDFKSLQGHSIKSTCVLCHTCRNSKDQTVWSVTFMVGCFYYDHDILLVCQLAKPPVTGFWAVDLKTLVSYFWTKTEANNPTWNADW